MRVSSLSFDDRTPDSGPFSYATREPFLTAEAATAVACARRIRQPVWLKGGPGAGAYEIARALHRDGDSLGFVSLRMPLVDARDLEARLRGALEDDFGASGLTLYAERIDRLVPTLQERLLRYSDEGAHWQGRAVPVRLMAQSDSGVRDGDLLPALRARLSALVVPLPSLVARRAEIGAIASAIAERLAAELGIAGAALDDAAIRELAERDWPRNVDELSAAVARLLFTAREPRAAELARVTAGGAAAGSSMISPTRPSSAGGTAPARHPPAHDLLDSRDIEQVVAELAHELKNPMVTIKTFGENLDTIFENPALREKFTALTREAIDRMDGYLEELMQFSRFSAPRKQLVPLSQVLAGAIRSHPPRVRDRVKLDGEAGRYRMRGDADQLTFALRSLLRGLSREIPEQAAIHVDVSPPGDVVFSSETGPEATPRWRAAGEAEDEPGLQHSLDFIMADALVRRHEGATHVSRDRNALEVRLHFPSLEQGDDA